MNSKTISYKRANLLVKTYHYENCQLFCGISKVCCFVLALVDPTEHTDQ